MESYTPPQYIELVRKVLGEIDLDARRDWSQEDVGRLIECIAKEGNDQELEDRLLCVEDTFAAYCQGKPITGDKELAQLIGTELAGHIEKWISCRILIEKRTRKGESDSHKSSVQGNGSIDITTDAAAADAFATAFKDRLVYSNGQWFYRDIQVLEPIPVEYAQGLAKLLRSKTFPSAKPRRFGSLSMFAGST